MLHITQVNEAEQFAQGYLAASVGSRVCWPQHKARFFKALQQRYSLGGGAERGYLGVGSPSALMQL